MTIRLGANGPCSTPATSYGMGHNELLIPEALRTRDRDEALVDAPRAVADELGASVAQVAIAWSLSRGEA